MDNWQRPITHKTLLSVVWHPGSWGKMVIYMGFSGGSPVKESACNAGNIGDVGLIPGSGRSPGGGHGNPFQCSYLENPMNWGACQATVYEVTKSQTQLKRQHTCPHGYMCTYGWVPLLFTWNSHNIVNRLWWWPCYHLFLGVVPSFLTPREIFCACVKSPCPKGGKCMISWSFTQTGFSPSLSTLPCICLRAEKQSWVCSQSFRFTTIFSAGPLNFFNIGLNHMKMPTYNQFWPTT